MCESESMALVMLDGAANALRLRMRREQDEEDDDEKEFRQDEAKVKRTLIGPDIPGTRKILPEHMPFGGLPPGGAQTLIGGM